MVGINNIKVDVSGSNITMSHSEKNNDDNY